MQVSLEYGQVGVAYRGITKEYEEGAMSTLHGHSYQFSGIWDLCFICLMVTAISISNVKELHHLGNWVFRICSFLMDESVSPWTSVQNLRHIVLGVKNVLWVKWSPHLLLAAFERGSSHEFRIQQCLMLAVAEWSQFEVRTL